MKQIAAFALIATLAAGPAAAQDDEAGSSLMEQGLELFFDGLRKEMAPALSDLQALAEEIGPAMYDFLAQMGPALADILEEVKDWSAYEAPEIQPNGDIIIRRKPDAPELEHDPDAKEIEI